MKTPARQTPSASPASLERVELAIALLLTAAALVLHVTFLRHAGGLWRDEVQIVNLSTTSTFAEAWQLNEHDTFPLLWQLTLRGWSALGPGATDGGLRLLGCFVGLGIAGMLWYCLRQFRVKAPMLSLPLFAMSPAVIVYGDSVRGYGFGLIWLFFMIGRLWRFVAEPTRRNAIWAAVAVLLAVHSFYFSVVLFVVLGGAGLGVFIRRRAWSAAWTLVGVGVLAALSMLPYLGVLARQRAWFDVIKSDVSVSQLWSRMAETINASGPAAAWTWALLFLVVLDASFTHALRWKSTLTSEDADRNLFVGGAALAGLATYLTFLLWRRHPTFAWYYLAILGFEAVLLDAGLAHMVEHRRPARLGRLAVALVVAVTVFIAAWPRTHVRLTNADDVAAHLNDAVSDGDLVVVNPWWPGVSFGRYYHGRAAWTTLPDLGPLPVQRFDRFRQKLFEPEPIAPVLARIASALQSGHRVWIVGELPAVVAGEDPGSVPPAPIGPVAQEPYLTIWARQTAAFIQAHATHGEDVPIGAGERVSNFEHLKLVVVQGWR